jgi:hypothetical protein
MKGPGKGRLGRTEKYAMAALCFDVQQFCCLPFTENAASH